VAGAKGRAHPAPLNANYKQIERFPRLYGVISGFPYPVFQQSFRPESNPASLDSRQKPAGMTMWDIGIIEHAGMMSRIHRFKSDKVLVFYFTDLY
jgi:hypothetical protein